jgi:hypothetical protein
MFRRSTAVAITFLALVAVALVEKLSAQSNDSNPLQLSPHHATATVANLDRESDWYRRVLGFQEVNRFKGGPDFEVRHLAIPGYRIDLVARKGSSRQHEVSGELSEGWLRPACRIQTSRLRTFSAVRSRNLAQ